VLLGRVFYSAIFILASFGHFTAKTINFAASQGVLFADILVPFSGLLALVGGLSILLGYKARYGAWLLVIFLVPVTYMMHKFWMISNPMMHDMQQAMFMKNTALLGAALLITHFGSGPLSLKR
jgi:putative oxidoreductase